MDRHKIGERPPKSFDDEVVITAKFRFQNIVVARPATCSK
jgi:hypothetical protein